MFPVCSGQHLSKVIQRQLVQCHRRTTVAHIVGKGDTDHDRQLSDSASNLAIQSTCGGFNVVADRCKCPIPGS